MRPSRKANRPSAGALSQGLLGFIAGAAASVAMTAAMRHLFSRLPDRERYPLPPREIPDALEPSPPAAGNRALKTLLAHLGYGGLAGAVFALLPQRPKGLLYGPAVWAISYLGWLPGLQILRSARHHPSRRNGLMLIAHLVWGATLVRGLRELEASRKDIFAEGRDRDHPTDL